METRNTLIKISIELAKNQLDFACHLVAKSSQIDATKGADRLREKGRSIMKVLKDQAAKLIEENEALQAEIKELKGDKNAN